MNTQLNEINEILIDTMKDVKSEKSVYSLGNSVSRLACQAIKAIVIDRELSIRERKQDNISKHIELQYAKLDRKTT